MAMCLLIHSVISMGIREVFPLLIHSCVLLFFYTFVTQACGNLHIVSEIRKE